jgi:hypothetical protein
MLAPREHLAERGEVDRRRVVRTVLLNADPKPGVVCACAGYSVQPLPRCIPYPRIKSGCLSVMFRNRTMYVLCGRPSSFVIGVPRSIGITPLAPGPMTCSQKYRPTTPDEFASPRTQSADFDSSSSRVDSSVDAASTTTRALKLNTSRLALSITRTPEARPVRASTRTSETVELGRMVRFPVSHAG